jgi:ketosteroid isomerase-like protein
VFLRLPGATVSGVTHEAIERWVAAYEAAWRAPGVDALAGVFAPGATYSLDPYEPTITGLDAIAELWDAERSEGEQFEMTHEVVAVEGDTAVVRVHVQYRRPREQEYRDVWIVRLGPDGLCTRFEEWPFFPDRPRVA